MPNQPTKETTMTKAFTMPDLTKALDNRGQRSSWGTHAPLTLADGCKLSVQDGPRHYCTPGVSFEVAMLSADDDFARIPELGDGDKGTDEGGVYAYVQREQLLTIINNHGGLAA
jgi:hypothetical protein